MPGPEHLLNKGCVTTKKPCFPSLPPSALFPDPAHLPGAAGPTLSPGNSALSFSTGWWEKEAIKLAATMVCKKTLPLQHVCKELVTKCLDKIIHGIMNGKSHEEICVKLKICKSEKGLGASGVSDATLGRSTESPTTPPASALPDPEPTLQCLSANFSLASPEGE
ncbi:uncharacterized protein LOC131484805 isoform X2 [Neofelis nebulosa]|uniref:uncharacterized protein LOC131484804 isoform X2 n=1 Tax=Neofelis nebulosa TaxID=61452 RepID=UPI00272BA7F8|nr:uncharacterized protein LOC131484804 isoform X2 [Neofelis nebulosa]XP_058539443.1 uncharacterized protein LOC131484805 isoform X2 [Neofelis nebulosa]